MRKFYNFFLIVTPLIVILAIVFPPPILHYNKMAVNISFDDVHDCIDDLYSNMDKYETPFEQPFFYRLKQLHDLFGAKFTLYMYLYGYDGKRLSVTRRYADDFKKNSSWLKFAFHGIRPTFTIEESEQYTMFAEAYKGINSLIKEMGGKESRILRLHYWFATPKEKTFLSKNHVRTLLTSDKDRVSYSLSDNEMRILHKGSYSDSLFHYLRTDLRLEEIEKVPYWALIQHKESDTLVIFSHEWAFNKWNKIKLARIIEILSLSNCNFIN